MEDKFWRISFLRLDEINKNFGLLRDGKAVLEAINALFSNN